MDFFLVVQVRKRKFIRPLGTRCVTHIMKDIHLLEYIKTFIKLLIPILVNLKGDQLSIDGVSKSQVLPKDSSFD